MRKKKVSETHKCGRCFVKFSSVKKLKEHSKKHTKAVQEVKMLEKGKMPNESKLGESFRGKNKVIIA